MYYHKFLIAAVTVILLLLNSCAPSYAPTNWLPNTDQIQKESFGGWLTLSIVDSISNTDFQIEGELISTDSEYVYVLSDSVINVVSKLYVTNSILEIDDKNTDAYAGLAVLGTLSTISNGYYLIFSAPMWIIGGSAAAGGESRRDRYVKEFPSYTYWDEIQNFSRFPQGLPPNLNLDELRPKKLSEND